MIRRLRLVLLIARPAVVLLLAMFAAIGLTQTGHGEDRLLLARVLLAVFGFLLFSVACNDIADEEIDRINLPRDQSRPLVARTGGRRELLVIGLVSAVVAVAASCTLGWQAAATTIGGLVLSANYSLRPIRIADRGALASLLLPAGYVAVPYLVGHFAASSSLGSADLTLLAGLYIGFIGRILLKDFRDVRGDALFGKRTFLVRHGRRWTCLFSACCLVAGAVVLLASLAQPTVAMIVSYIVGSAVILVLLRALSTDRGPRRDESIIATIAIIGRGTLLMLLAHLAMVHAQWPAAGYNAVMGALAFVTAGFAVPMLRHGPITRFVIPFTAAAAAPARPKQAAN